MAFRQLLALTTVLLALPATAAAQHHHHGGHGDDETAGDDAHASESGELMLHAQIAVEAGRVEAFGNERSYQGMSVMLGARHGRFEAMAHVPLYRIDLGARNGTGLGDIHIGGGWIALAGDEYEAGVTAGVMPPWGDDDDGLGMGHWMLMAGTFARASRGRLNAAASLGWGGAPEENPHADHGVAVWPPVAPMNAQEIQATTQVGVTLWRQLGATANAALALPIGDGDVLAQLGGDLTAQLGRFQLAAGLRHGLAGHTAGWVVSSRLMAMF